MGLIKEFRTLQKDVAVLRSKSGDDVASTGSGFQGQGTAGFLSSSTAGTVKLGCTAYASDTVIQNAFFAGSIALTAVNSGAVDIMVKRGRNKLSFANAGIIEPSNAFQGSQYLSSAGAWLPNASGAAYAAIARSPHRAVVAPLASGGGGDVPSGWHEAQKAVVTSVNYATNTLGNLVLDVQTVNLKYVEWS